MNRILIAKQLLILAKHLMAMEFDTEEEKKKYQQDHDVRSGTKLTVKKSEPKGKSDAAGNLVHTKSEWQSILKDVDSVSGRMPVEAFKVLDGFSKGKPASKKEIEDASKGLIRQMGSADWDEKEVFQKAVKSLQKEYNRL